MPRNVRNFWVTGRADGRDNPVTFGPVGRGDGIEIRVQQRHDGDVTDALRIKGYVDSDGNCHLVVFDDKGEKIHGYITRR